MTNQNPQSVQGFSFGSSKPSASKPVALSGFTQVEGAVNYSGHSTPRPQDSALQHVDFARGVLGQEAQHNAQTSEVERKKAFLEELTSSGEVVSKEHMEEAIELAKEQLRQELEEEHQQAIEELKEQQTKAIAKSVEEFQRWREAITHQSTELLLRLTETLTMHLVQDALMDQPERYIDAMKSALHTLVGFANPRLYVPTFAVAELVANSDRIKELHPDHVEVKVIADDKLKPGDFRIEVDGGAVEAELEKRLKHLVQTCRERALSEFAEWDEDEQEY